jgi:hypothetical protein
MRTRSRSLVQGQALQGWPPAALARLRGALGAAAETPPPDAALGYEGAFPFLAGMAADEDAAPCDPAAAGTNPPRR